MRKGQKKANFVTQLMKVITNATIARANFTKKTGHLETVVKIMILDSERS